MTNLTKPGRWRTIALAALLASLASPAAMALELVPCRIDAGSALDTEKARCGVLQVPEDPTAPDGRTIGLYVALVPALNVEPLGDPLVLLAGGPGQSAVDSYLMMAGSFERVRRDRPILLVDQRGTGRSNPMTCPDVELGDATFNPSPAEVREQTEACLAALPGDPRFYTTSIAVADLDAVREALGYAQLNLWGGSYGTRVALHYLKTYPQHTRSAIIDGVVPADLPLGPAIAIDAQASLDLLFDRCDEDNDCRSAFGDLRARFDALRDALSETPVSVTMTHPRTGEQTEQLISNELLSAVVRMSSYAPIGRAMLPLLIDEAANGRYQMLAAQGALIEDQFDSLLAIGMHNAVICSEDVPRFATVVDNEALAASYMGEMQLQFLKEICSIWPAGPVDAGFNDPVTSDLPVLVLSGEVDPVTPPAYGDRAARTLANSRHIVAPGQGHIVSPHGCVPKLIGEFVDTLDPGALDVNCVERLGTMPIFVSPVGPTP